MYQRSNIYGDQHFHFKSHGTLPKHIEANYDSLDEFDGGVSHFSPSRKFNKVDLIQQHRSQANYSWRSLIKSDVSMKYQEILSQRKAKENSIQLELSSIERPNINLSTGNSPSPNAKEVLPSTTGVMGGESKQELQSFKMQYQEKIKTLEHQNQNLKEELFYLRAAILAKYESKKK